MERRNSARRALVSVCLTVCLVVMAAGLTCPPTDGGGSLSPLVPPGNRPPRILITGIDTPGGNNTAEVGELATISFTGEDGEETATARIFASTSSNPSAAQEIHILDNYPIGPGVGSGTASWNTTGVSPAAYNVFAEISDGVNPTIRVVASQPLQVVPPGSTPLNSPPQIVMIDPLPNMGLSAQDDVTVRYIYADTDTQVTVTMLLDKDLNPNNDNINNPGDPFDPNSKIIILPTQALLPTDPVGDADLRRNPRTLNPTASGIFPFPGAPLTGELIQYQFIIDFSQIPIRSQPYFIRATISDGIVTRHAYAVGSITISALAQGIVDVSDLGFSLAGARFQGFSEQENLGTDFVNVTDNDLDGLQDFMIASRFGSPRNRFQCGAGYLLFGRKKTPFPPDTNGNGIPDSPDGQGNPVDLPIPPDYLPNPYDARNIGRFGGIVSINSVGSFFRGSVYGMPEASRGPAGRFYYYDAFGFPPTAPPPDLDDLDHSQAFTAGLTSITRFDFNGDDVPDFIFGLPFISGAYDHTDDDPADGCGNPYSDLGDLNPTNFRCSNQPSRDNLDAFADQGQVIMVDGTADIRNTFRLFVDAGLAGQFNDPFSAVDDEGVGHGTATIPNGVRLRGGWFNDDQYGVGTGLGIDKFNQMGRTVAGLPSVDNDAGDDLAVSSPAFSPSTANPPFLRQGTERGKIDIWRSQNYQADIHYGGEPTFSLPTYTVSRCDSCVTTINGPTCQRCYLSTPVHTEITGEADFDHLGYASAAGQFNQDGIQDIVAGAPGADRQAIVNNIPVGPVLTDNGIFYVFFMPAGGPGITDLEIEPFPRLEIIGSHSGDQFGFVQGVIEDINADGIADVAFASEFYDDISAGGPGADAGFTAVIFGDRPLTGENGFAPEQVGTGVLAGIRFRARGAGHHMGRDVTSAGDFNGDGFGDLLITVPDETRVVGSETRVGVTYLIFGGNHLNSAVNGRPGNLFGLDEVGTAQLPGIVFIGRLLPDDTTVAGTDEMRAPLEYVGGIGDIDGDGFDDIMIGSPKADFVDPFATNQRRLNAGEAYLIYGNDFGSNTLP